MKRLTILAVVLALTLGFLGANDISFEGGKTSMQTQAGRQVITLSDRARIQSGSIILRADTITLSGDDFRYVLCSGNVVLEDEERELNLRSNRLFYDRDLEEIRIEGYFELDDPKNELLARGFGLTYSIDEEQLALHAQAHVEKHTSSGAMVCKADLMHFDRKLMSLSLYGKALVDWSDDHYEAQQIIVDLEKEQITAEGSIKGVIHG